MWNVFILKHYELRIVNFRMKKRLRLHLFV